MSSSAGVAIRSSTSTARAAVRRFKRRFERPVDRRSTPIFVCGASHSGTTLLVRCIGQHSGIHAIRRETWAFCHDPGRMTIATHHREWVDEARAAGRDRYAEKTPDHVFHIGRILHALPSSRIAIIERDGRDVAASLGARNGDVAGAAEKWVRAIACGRRAAQDPRVARIRYEDLATDPETALAALCSSLEVVFELGMVEVAPDWEWQPRDHGDHGRRRQDQMRQAVYDGRGSWRELPAEELERVLAIAGPTLRELGYLT